MIRQRYVDVKAAGYTPNNCNLFNASLNAIHPVFCADSGHSLRLLNSTPRADCTDACNSLVEGEVNLGSIRTAFVRINRDIVANFPVCEQSELPCELLEWVSCSMGRCDHRLRSGFKLCCIPYCLEPRKDCWASISQSWLSTSTMSNLCEIQVRCQNTISLRKHIIGRDKRG
jgi:hypothetical protein